MALRLPAVDRHRQTHPGHDCIFFLPLTLSRVKQAVKKKGRDPENAVTHFVHPVSSSRVSLVVDSDDKL